MSGSEEAACAGDLGDWYLKRPRSALGAHKPRLLRLIVGHLFAMMEPIPDKPETCPTRRRSGGANPSHRGPV